VRTRSVVGEGAAAKDVAGIFGRGARCRWTWDVAACVFCLQVQKDQYSHAREAGRVHRKGCAPSIITADKRRLEEDYALALHARFECRQKVAATRGSNGWSWTSAENARRVLFGAIIPTLHL
jgi:hypothetical protein